MRGIVVSVDDPDERGRVRCAIPDLFLDGETGTVLDSQWCESKGGGLLGAGSLDVPKVGTQVWVQSVYSAANDTFDLVYERGNTGKAKEGSFAPAVGRGKDDDSVRLKVSPPFSLPSATAVLERRSPADNKVTRPEDTSRVEIPGIPTSANAGVYPHNRVLKTEGGFVLELDDTPGNERLQLHHPSGASVEVYGSGVWSQRSSKKWEEVLEHDTKHVWGDERVRVDGHVTRGVGGNSVEEVSGRKVLLAGEVDYRARFDLLMEVGGMFRQRVTGPAVQRFLNDWRATSGGAVNLSSLSDFGIMSGLGAVNVVGAKGINMNSPLNVSIHAGALLDMVSIGAASLACSALAVTTGAMQVTAAAATNLSLASLTAEIGATNISTAAMAIEAANVLLASLGGLNVIAPLASSFRSVPAVPVWPVLVKSPLMEAFFQALLTHTHEAGASLPSAQLAGAGAGYETGFSPSLLAQSAAVV